MTDTDATNGRPYIVTGMDKAGDRRMQVHILTPAGKRRSVVLDVWHLADEILASAAAAFDNDTRLYPAPKPRATDDGSHG